MKWKDFWRGGGEENDEAARVVRRRRCAVDGRITRAARSRKGRKVDFVQIELPYVGGGGALLLDVKIRVFSLPLPLTL